MTPFFYHIYSHDSLIQKAFKIHAALPHEFIFGRVAFKGLRMASVNDFPANEHLCTAWNYIVEPEGDPLPLLLNPSYPDIMAEHLATPSVDYPGYWTLSGKSGLFFDNVCCVDHDRPRDIYFYGLTDDEMMVLHHRTQLNKKYAQRDIIFDYMTDVLGAHINTGRDDPSHGEKESVISDADEDDSKPPASKKMKSDFSHPAQGWLHHYTSDYEDSDNESDVWVV